MGRPRIFEHQDLREPALRPDGKPYAESMVVRADCIRVGDCCTEVGTVMSVKFKGADKVIVAGRLVQREWPLNARIQIIRRNWDKVLKP